MKFTIRASEKWDEISKSTASLLRKGILLSSSFVVMTITILDVTDALMKRKVDELRAAVSNWMEDESKGCSRRFCGAVFTSRTRRITYHFICHYRHNWCNCNIQYEEEIIDHCSFALITKFKLRRSLHHRLLKSIFNS